MSVFELVTPEVVSGASDTKYDPLDPCTFCGARPHESPEGVHSVHTAHKYGVEPGSARWVHPHCWRCGYRDGTAVSINQDELRKAFQLVQNAYNAHLAKEANKPGMAPALNSPAGQDEIARLKAELAEKDAQLANLQPNEVEDHS